MWLWRSSLGNSITSAGWGLGEWRGGFAPPRSRRTVREPLSSYGSHCRATLRTQLPVSKELWSALSNTQQPLLGSAKPVLQLLVFPRRPSGEHAVEVLPEGIKPRAVKPPVVLNPTPDDRVKHTGKIRKRRVAAQVQLPVSNRSPYGLAGFLRNGRTEVDEVLSLATLRASGTKRIAQKIKLLLSIPFPSIIIVLTFRHVISGSLAVLFLSDT